MHDISVDSVTSFRLLSLDPPQRLYMTHRQGKWLSCFWNVWCNAAHADKALYTQLSLDTREVFLQYQHNSDAVSDVTFNLKDFKHMLSMCESLGANVAIRFDQPGAPLVVEPQFRANPVSDPPVYHACTHVGPWAQVSEQQSWQRSC